MSLRFYRFAKVVCNVVCKLWFKLEYYGMENLPTDRGYILVGNHQSYWDPVMMGLKLNTTLTFMANEKLFHKPVLAPIIRGLGAFPVNLKKPDMTAIRTAKKVVKEGKVLALFPEGTRSHDGKLLKFKGGVIYIASVTGEDVVPVCITYGNGGKFRSRILIRYGQVIPNQEVLEGKKKDTESMRQAAVKLQSVVQQLQDENLAVMKA
ncbi:MAG TPA: 1-acyl-sn-glycerol-3-phosphate acyltransferase [Candidatus Egerieicola pullicola]|uniref:1-acyl-sn-glycerol-3-phosphate acyltransferase n=1 Tax=Candidatus Egerieicola pullicola TaxID=2840775 RepID=A0A9D1DCL0_9FIRM|nr:1-acyl-sn-glycerol-3-phosphate acyltransferase [Candidatus Egerieicola pullicola]